MRPLGRPRSRWENNIKIDFREIGFEGVDLIFVAQDTDPWRALSRYQGFKTVGPFVVMIYCKIMGDVLQFVSIYLVFVMGSSQCKYVRGNKMKWACISNFHIVYKPSLVTVYNPILQVNT
jgi:hypothetical protein